MLPVLGACQDQDQHFLVKAPTWDSQMDSGKTTLITHGWILLASFLQVKEQLREENEDSSWDSSWDYNDAPAVHHSPACHFPRSLSMSHTALLAVSIKVSLHHSSHSLPPAPFLVLNFHFLLKIQNIYSPAKHNIYSILKVV